MNDPAWLPEQVYDKDPRLAAQALGPQVLAQRPGLARCIGQIFACCSEVETCLVETLAYVITAEEWVVAELFSNVRNYHERRRIFSDHVGRKFGPDARADSETLLKEFGSYVSQRNDFAHRRMILPQQVPDGIVLVKGWGKDQTLWLYTQAMLDALVAECYRSAERVNQLCMWFKMNSPQQYASGRIIWGTQPLSEESLEQLRVDMDAVNR